MEDDNNIIDFIEFRMHALIESVATDGELALAKQMSDALDGYLMGKMSIEFVDGWPLVENIEENNT